MEAPASSKHEQWVQRFSVRLRELQPVLREEDAAQVAHVAFHSANDLDPAEAAEVFAEILAASVPVHDLKRWIKVKEGAR